MIITVVLSIVAVIGLLKLVHYLIGVKLIKFFLTYEQQVHGGELCGSKWCQPLIRKSGMYQHRMWDGDLDAYNQKYRGDEKKDKRIKACVLMTASKYSKNWHSHYPRISRHLKVAGAYSEVLADAERLRVLEAEKAEQEANVERIRKELEITAEDLFAREFAKHGIDMSKLSR